MIRFACPKCKTVLQANDDQAGAVIGCPSCKTPLRSPRPAAAPAAPPPTAAPPPIEWYYAREGQRHGPFGEAQLRAMAAAGEVRPTDQVCSTASPAWTPAALLFGAAPPTASAEPAPAPTGVTTRFAQEARETARGTWAHARRLMAYGGALSRTHRLRRAVEEAARALGERMLQTGAGDPAVRTRIAAVDEEIRQAAAAKRFHRALRTERDALLRQLAAPAIAAAVPPPGLEAEHARVRDADVALQKHLESVRAARAALPPTDRLGWRRVLTGYAVAGGALLFAGALFLAVLYILRPQGSAGPAAVLNGTNDPSSGAPRPIEAPPPGKLMVIEQPVWTARADKFSSAVEKLVFMPGGKLLFTRADNGHMQFFTLDKGEDWPSQGFMIPNDDYDLVNLPDHWDDYSLFARYLADDQYHPVQNGIRAIAKDPSESGPFLNDTEKFLSPDGKTVATAVRPLPLRLWDVETGKRKTLQLEDEDRWDVSPNPYHVTAAAFSPDGKKLAAWGVNPAEKSSLKVWDLDSGKKLATLVSGPNAFSAPPRPIHFSPDGALIAADVPLKDQHMLPTLWDCTSWQELAELHLGDAINFRVRDISPDHKVVVTTDGSTRYRVTTWETTTGKMLHRTDPVDAENVFFSPDGRSVIAGGNDYQTRDEPLHDVNVWDVASGRLTHRLTDERIYTVALGPDGKTLATGHMRLNDNARAEVKLWDLTKGMVVPLP